MIGENRDVLKYLGCEFYTIEQNGPEKNVHYEGYVYLQDGVYHGVEMTGVYIDINRFPNNYEKELFEKESICTQYQNDMEEEAEAVAYMEGYFSRVEGDDWIIEPYTELAFEDITPDTPYGCYVNYKPKNE